MGLWQQVILERVAAEATPIDVLLAKWQVSDDGH